MDTSRDGRRRSIVVRAVLAVSLVANLIFAGALLLLGHRVDELSERRLSALESAWIVCDVALRLDPGMSRDDVVRELQHWGELSGSRWTRNASSPTASCSSSTPTAVCVRSTSARSRHLNSKVTKIESANAIGSPSSDAGR
jgi:hypothetical protein